MEDRSRMRSRLHIPALFSRDFFAEGFTVIPNLLIKYSGRLGLDGTDLLVMMSFCYFQQRGQYELEISDFARLINVSEDLIHRSIEKLRDLGLLTDKEDLQEFIDSLPTDILVVVDEAYDEYVTDPSYSSAVELLNSNKNVIVLRTFSKVYGLAGLRVGYGMASPEIISLLNLSLIHI